jgi:uncharacterized protein (TIGR03067 family)
MKSIIGMAGCLMLAVPVAVADEKDDAAKKLNGTYEVIELVVGGEPVPGYENSKKMAIKDGTLKLVIGGEEAEPSTFILDPSKKPAHIDISNGTEEGPGIYAVKETADGLELTIAYAMKKGIARPKDFKGDGDGIAVMKLLRKKVK